jgi:hypothetical protein
MIVPLAGFAAGAIHVLAGPDHLAAVAPLAARHPRGSWRSGLRWGLGHAGGVCVVGLATILLRGLLPVDLVSHYSERLVGVMLIGIGAWALRKGMQIHTHAHEHGGERHEHIHMHAKGEQHVHAHAAFAFGTLHGLAGSSHVMGILPALALPSNVLAASYLIFYGIGTVAAMTLFSHGIGMVAGRWQGNALKLYRGLMFACAAVALGVGTVWVSGYSF